MTRFIKSYDKIIYRSADLNDPSVDDRVDITNITIYKTASVDIFLCSHVLEHVENDDGALRELFRILRPGGWGIIMVPIALQLKTTLEDFSVKTEADRWKHFGQGDHVRLYSKSGFVDRLNYAGFKVNQLGVKYFGKEVFAKAGLAPRSTLYVVEKARAGLCHKNLSPPR